MHPDVLHVPDGFLGYPYWMACTPYPFAQDRAENPIVRVSRDGIDWHPFPGAPDPLVDAPPDGDWHHADTDLVLHQGELHVFYISTNRHAAQTTFSVVRSRNGVDWTPPLEIYRDTWGVSPAVVLGDAGTWQVWYVWRDALARSQESTLLRRTGPAVADLGPPEPCTLRVPGHVVWHLDVIATGDLVEALVTAFPTGTDPSRSRVFHAVSRDGRSFDLTDPAPLIRPSWFGWDNRMVYRSTFVKQEGGRYRIWYSAASWGMRCGIGLLEGSLDALRPCPSGGNSIAWRHKLREDGAGLLKYLVYRALPKPLYEQMLAVRNHLRGSA